MGLPSYPSATRIAMLDGLSSRINTNVNAYQSLALTYSTLLLGVEIFSEPGGNNPPHSRVFFSLRRVIDLRASGIESKVTD